MTHIERPAWRLTADCIWNSFRSSGRRHLILTGDRGSGKSTLLARLFPDPLPGVTTYAVPRQGVYFRDDLTGITAEIGRFAGDLPGSQRKMLPVEDSFHGFGTDTLKKLADVDSRWVSVDEIGFLEKCSPRYLQALHALFAEKQVAACVRKEELATLSAELSDALLVDLDDPYGDVGCVIMASGLGKRFGGNKLMADFHGEPMIARCLAATEDLPRRLVVTRSSEVAHYCRARQVDMILHSLPGRNDTVRLGLEGLGTARRYLFCPADQPLLTADTVNALALCGKNAGAYIWRPESGGTVGAPILFPGWAAPELMALPEGKGGGFVAKKYPEQIRTLSVRDAFELMDADTREEYSVLLER